MWFHSGCRLLEKPWLCGVVQPDDKKGRKTRWRLKPSKVNRAEVQWAAAAKCPKSLEWSLLVVLLTLFVTVGMLTSFYSSRTMRSIKFQQYQWWQWTFAKIVQEFAPDPSTIAVWGVNFFGMHSSKDGKELAVFLHMPFDGSLQKLGV